MIPSVFFECFLRLDVSTSGIKSDPPGVDWMSVPAVVGMKLVQTVPAVVGMKVVHTVPAVIGMNRSQIVVVAGRDPIHLVLRKDDPLLPEMLEGGVACTYPTKQQPQWQPQCQNPEHQAQFDSLEL